eukprot:c19166_g4_i1 orf=36-2957(+)
MRRGNSCFFGILRDELGIAGALQGTILLGSFTSFHSSLRLALPFATEAKHSHGDGGQASSYASLLRSCNCLSDGMLVHQKLIRDGLQNSVLLGNSLLQMYTDFRASEDALALFGTMFFRDAFAWTLIIRAHSHSRDLALAHFQQMQQEGVLLRKFASIGFFSACTDEASLADGKRMHAIVFASGLEKDVYVATAILSMYGNCCSIRNASATFERMSNRDTVAWNAMLAAYIDVGKANDALTLFQHMHEAGITPTKATFLSALDACATVASLEASKSILKHIFAQRLQGDIAVGNAITNMYSKCGSIDNARTFFDQMLEHDTISWNTMIAAYTQNGQEKEALALFDQMQVEKIPMDKVTFVSLLSACTSPMALLMGEKLHNHIMCVGIDSDVVVGTALVNMYGKSSSLDEAYIVFNTMLKRDIITWNAMISAYSQHGFCDAALQVLDHMQSNNVKPDKVTFVSILDACACQENLNGGRKVHDLIQGSELDVMVGTALIRMYGVCGCLEEAEILFDKVSEKDIILWNCMMSLYVQHDKSSRALVFFDQMLGEGIMPNNVTCSSLLNAYASQSALAMGKRMHACCVGSSFELDIVVGTALMNMYGKCGCLEAAHLLFDRMNVRDLIAWTAMISLLAQQEHHCEAFQLFAQLQQEGMLPDIVTIVGMISACASEEALFICKQIHACVVVTEFVTDIVLGNALVNTYGKCGSLEGALISFEQMPKRDNVSFLTILCACAAEAALREGQKVHSLLAASGLECDTTLSHALVNMYGKCGALKDAKKLFDQMTDRNVVSWNALITAYSQSGEGENALLLFEQMQDGETKPDNLTVVSVLTACSHAGLVDEGCAIFFAISQIPSVSLILDHYNCMLDILARAGQLDEAEGLIKVMPLRPTAITWTTLLGACKTEGLIKVMPLRPTAITWTTLLGACKTEVDVKRGERVAAHAMLLGPEDAAIHVSLSNIYSASGRMPMVDMG